MLYCHHIIVIIIYFVFHHNQVHVTFFHISSNIGQRKTIKSTKLFLFDSLLIFLLRAAQFEFLYVYHCVYQLSCVILVRNVLCPTSVENVSSVTFVENAFSVTCWLKGRVCPMYQFVFCLTLCHLNFNLLCQFWSNSSISDLLLCFWYACLLSTVLVGMEKGSGVGEGVECREGGGMVIVVMVSYILLAVAIIQVLRDNNLITTLWFFFLNFVNLVPAWKVKEGWWGGGCLR